MDVRATGAERRLADMANFGFVELVPYCPLYMEIPIASLCVALKGRY